MKCKKQVIDAIVRNDGALYDVVYLYGSREAALSWVEELLKTYAAQYPDRKVFCTDGVQFLMENTLVLGRGLEFAMPECELYVFGDLEAVAGREGAEQRLYGILDHQLEHRHRILAWGREPLCNAVALADRINAQLSGGVSFCVD